MPDDVLANLVTSSFQKHLTKAALELGFLSYSYKDLWQFSDDFITENSDAIGSYGAIGILTQRTLESYVAILAAVRMGRPYVSLNMKFPFDRQLHIAKESHCKFIVADESTTDRRAELFSKINDTSKIYSPAPSEQVRENINKVAYYMFTSGTTGIPKGVIAYRDNLAAYLMAIDKILAYPAGVRCSQFFELSFDVSVHDIFYTWTTGGVLCPMGPGDSDDAIAFAKSKSLQSWYSVPSLISFADRNGSLKDNVLPDLQWSLFAGEALPTGLAKKWMAASPKSIGFNLYGPTEGTITVLGRSFNGEYLKGSSSPTVPIGVPNIETEVVLIKSDGERAAGGEAGELWIGGPQIVPGYLHNSAETDKRFVLSDFADRRSARWYRTGDLVEQTTNGEYVFFGRLDDQIKIRGYRVELFEIEGALREAASTADAAAVPWPINSPGNADGVVGFVVSTADETAILSRCSDRLPTYMVPTKIISVPSLPLNINGKVDHNALRRDYLSGGSDQSTQRSKTALESELIKAWSDLFPERSISASSTFVSLRGDSLSYVNGLMAAEKALGSLPENWTQLSIANLALSATPEKKRWLTRVDTPALLRAVAIILVLLEHLRYINKDFGEIGPLMVLSGYFFGKLQLNDGTPQSVISGITRSIFQLVLLYYIVLLPLLNLAGLNIDFPAMLMYGDFIASRYMYLWYLHSILHIYIAIALITLLATIFIPNSVMKKKYSSLLFFTMVGIGSLFFLIFPMVVPYAQAVNMPGVYHWSRNSCLGQMFLFACGGALGFSRPSARWVGLALLGVGTISSFCFGFGAEGAATLLAALILVFFTDIKLPKFLSVCIYVISNASLFLYVLHPPLRHILTHFGVPRIIILFLVIFIGIFADWIWNWAGRQVVSWRLHFMNSGLMNQWRSQLFRPRSVRP